MFGLILVLFYLVQDRFVFFMAYTLLPPRPLCLFEGGLGIVRKIRILLIMLEF